MYVHLDLQFDVTGRVHVSGSVTLYAEAEESCDAFCLSSHYSRYAQCDAVSAVNSFRKADEEWCSDIEQLFNFPFKLDSRLTKASIMCLERENKRPIKI